MKKSETLRSFFRRMWKLNPRFMIALFLQKMLLTARTLLMVYIPKLLLDFIRRGASVPEAAEALGVLAAALLVLYFLDSLAQRTVSIEMQKQTHILDLAFSEKLMAVPYAYLEDPVYLEMKEAAKMGMGIGGTERILNSFSGIIEKAMVLLGLAAFLLYLSPLLFAAIVLLQLPVWFLLKRKTVLFRKVVEGIVPTNRKLNYFFSVIVDDRFQKDVRLYDMSEMLCGHVLHYNQIMMEDFIRMDRKDAVYACIIQAINFLISASVFFYAGSRVLGGSLSVGDFSLYAGAAVNFSLSARDLLNFVLELMNQVHFIEPLEAFFALPDEAEEPGAAAAPSEIESIEFRDLWFRYPKTEEWILRGISFTIRKGEKISVVGLNGAGKSTLVKLLCRFFRPSKGAILLNGRDIGEYEHKSYMALISAVFQDFQILKFSVAENILNDRYDDENARLAAVRIMEKVGLGRELPQGLDSVLGKTFRRDGIELSGGQLQKIAIARALYKNAPLIILDEPTSALDPLAEAEIYEDFNRLIGDKTAIYISHRMSSSVFCDRIAVINSGELEAFDTHARLMQNPDSLYYKLFTTQAEYYKLEAGNRGELSALVC